MYVNVYKVYIKCKAVGKNGQHVFLSSMLVLKKREDASNFRNVSFYRCETEEYSAENNQLETSNLLNIYYLFTY